MALSSMDEVSPSMDEPFIRQIFGENCMHHILQMRIPFQLENMMHTIFTKNLMDEDSIHEWRNHIHG